jgi:hypothetical protein
VGAQEAIAQHKDVAVRPEDLVRNWGNTTLDLLSWIPGKVGWLAALGKAGAGGMAPSVDAAAEKAAVADALKRTNTRLVSDRAEAQQSFAPVRRGGTVMTPEQAAEEAKGGFWSSLVSEEMEKLLNEKAKSKSQQRFMGMVRKCQETGDCASEEVRKAAKSMKKKDASDFAKTKHKGLPEKKRKKK